MKRQFLQVSIMALCGAMIFGSANAALADAVHEGKTLKDTPSCSYDCQYQGCACASFCENLDDREGCIVKCNTDQDNCNNNCPNQTK